MKFYIEGSMYDDLRKRGEAVQFWWCLAALLLPFALIPVSVWLSAP